MKKKIKPKEELLNEYEKLETEDWINDCKKREWKQSEEYAKRQKLLEQFKNKI